MRDLSEMRIEKGLSEQKLALLVGVAEEDVRSWESGSIPPSGCLLRLAAALGVGVEEILKIYAAPANGAGAEEQETAERQKTESGDGAAGSSHPDPARLRADRYSFPDADYKKEIERQATKMERPMPVEPSGHNGFSLGETIFGIIVCVLCLIAGYVGFFIKSTWREAYAPPVEAAYVQEETALAGGGEGNA